MVQFGRPIQEVEAERLEWHAGAYEVSSGSKVEAQAVAAGVKLLEERQGTVYEGEAEEDYLAAVHQESAALLNEAELACQGAWAALQNWVVVHLNGQDAWWKVVAACRNLVAALETAEIVAEEAVPEAVLAVEKQ